MIFKFDEWPQKYNRAHPLYYTKLFASFQIHRWIQIVVTIRMSSIQVKIGDFFPLDLEIWQMPLENKRALLICYFKLCAYAQFGSKSVILCPVWSWNFMTLKSSRTPLLCCFKLCVSFHSHQWILTEVTVWKHSFWVKIGDFVSRVTLKFDRRPWK